MYRDEYIIVKSSRINSIHCYNGPSWDAAGLRERRQEIYDDKEVAEHHAKELSKVNPVGFVVVKTK